MFQNSLIKDNTIFNIDIEKENQILRIMVNRGLELIKRKNKPVLNMGMSANTFKTINCYSTVEAVMNVQTDANLVKRGNAGTILGINIWIIDALNGVIEISTKDLESEIVLMN